MPGLFYVFFRIVIDLGLYMTHYLGFWGSYVFRYVLCIYINQKRSWSMGYGKAIFGHFGKVNNSRILENGIGQISASPSFGCYLRVFPAGGKGRGTDRID